MLKARKPNTATTLIAVSIVVVCTWDGPNLDPVTKTTFPFMLGRSFTGLKIFDGAAPPMMHGFATNQDKYDSVRTCMILPTILWEAVGSFECESFDDHIEGNTNCHIWNSLATRYLTLWLSLG